MRLLVLMMTFVLVSSAVAEEPWMFPVRVDIPTGEEELSSLRMSEMYAESEGERYAENTSRVVHASVATFEDIVRWYSEKLAVPDLPTKLAAFNKRVVTEPDLRLEQLSHQWDAPMKTRAIVTSWFTNDQKQVSTLFPDEDGNIIAISILGTRKSTRIVVMRRRSTEAVE